jgi:hypothetical protein
MTATISDYDLSEITAGLGIATTADRYEAAFYNAPIPVDDWSDEPLTPGIEIRTADGVTFTGIARTFAWSVPNDTEVTVSDALAMTGLLPGYWEIEYVTAHRWEDAGGRMIAFEIRISESTTPF